MDAIRRMVPLAALVVVSGCARLEAPETSEADRARDAFLAARVEAWSEGTGRGARLIVDRMAPGDARPVRSIVRWADGGDFEVLRPGGTESVTHPVYAAVWGDFLESVLANRQGVALPVGRPVDPPAGDRILVYLRRDGGWVRFGGLRSREEVIRTSDPAAAAWLREHPEKDSAAVDSAAEAVEKLVEALDAW